MAGIGLSTGALSEQVEIMGTERQVAGLAKLEQRLRHLGLSQSNASGNEIHVRFPLVVQSKTCENSGYERCKIRRADA